MDIVSAIENYLSSYITLTDPQYRLPLALWVIGTYAHPDFDAYPYLVITSATKRSGKTRLSELISFAASNPRNFAAMTGATLFRSIENEHPTLIVDEAEKLSREGSTDMRAILNVGYRQGQTIPRTVGQRIQEFQTYCPKVFVLIGDVYDTLRDRSIIVTMRRAEAPRRFVYSVAKDEGASLRELISAAAKERAEDIRRAFIEHAGLDFLMDRDEEIWTALFAVAEVFCPGRIDELKQAAMDMATEKTQDAKRHTELLAKAEAAAQSEEYGRRLLFDLQAAFVGHGHVLATATALELLKGIPVAPWRKFRGDGLDAHDMSNLLSPFGVRPVRIAIGSGKGKQKFYRGYRLRDIDAAIERHALHP